LLKRGDRGCVACTHTGHQCLLSCIARALLSPRCSFLLSAPLDSGGSSSHSDEVASATGALPAPMTCQ
jgi:hypothetical protein